MIRENQVQKEWYNILDQEEENIKLSDLFDIEFLQKFQDAFSSAVGVSSIITDKNGVPITKGSNFCDFCTKLNRGSEKGLKRCMRSDAYGGTESTKTGKPVVYFCSNGLMDFAAPIILNGKQIGSFLGGQTLPTNPDKEKFLKIAEEIDVDPDEYLAALEKVKIVSVDQVRATADLLFLIAGEFSKMGYQKLSLMKMSANLHENVFQMMATVEEIMASATQVTSNQNVLNNEIENVKIISEQINEVTESIKGIANQSHLLGLNAAIEAARSGKFGLGFSVVAERIQKLASESKNTVNKIKQFTSQINDSVTKTSEMSCSTLMTTEQQEIATKDIVKSIEDIVRMTKDLSIMAAGSNPVT